MKLSWLSLWWPISLKMTFTWSSFDMQCYFLPSWDVFYLFLSNGLSGKQESPWNKNLISWNSLLYYFSSSWLWTRYCNSSNTMHPKLHISEDWSYCFSIIEISGARYHLEPTCKLMYLFCFFLLGLSLSNSDDISFFMFSYVCHILFVLYLSWFFLSSNS